MKGFLGNARRLIALAALSLVFERPICLPVNGTPAAAKPNIVFILADDLGYGDLGCQNPGSKIRTPRLDRLASEGLRFTDAHAPCSLCTPSRYSILTGQHCWRSRLKSGVLNMWDEPLIPAGRLTVAGMLRNNGYRTACFGKWHLGLSWPFQRTIPSGFDLNVRAADIDWTGRIGGGPVDCGFDYYFGVNIPNQPPYAFIENDHIVGLPTVHYPTRLGQQGYWAGPGVAGWDFTQLLPQVASNAVQWIHSTARRDSKPFFLYLPLVGPHQPVVPNAQFQGSSQAGIYGDYVQELDWAVGEVLDALQSCGAASNTLVIFTSDNGPDEFAYSRLRSYGHASMGQLRGIKNDIWEGGHRIPFLARWPGKITSGSISTQTISLIDFMRTVAELTGAQVPGNAAEDSVSFLPALLGLPESNSVRRVFVLESGCGQFGIRSNNWMYIDSSTGDGHNPELEPLWFKQIRGYTPQAQGPALLYDLGKDLTQGTNLLNRRPGLAKQLVAQLERERASYIWNVAGSSEWTLSSNWMPKSVPAGADVVYSNVVGLASANQTIGASLGINSLILDSSTRSDVHISAAAGSTLTIANGVDMSVADANLVISAPVALHGSQMWNVSSNRALFVNGALNLEAYELTLSGQGDTFFAGPISGSSRLKIRGGGMTELRAKNLFSGGIELSGGGLLVARDDNALGTGALSIPNNSTLVVAPGITLTNAAVVKGDGAWHQSQLCGAISVLESGSAAYTGPLMMSADTALRAATAASVLTIGGPIHGDATLTILAGAGTVIFAVQQSYNGRTVIEGRLKLSGRPDRLPVSTDLVFADSSSAVLDLNNEDQTVASISGGGASGGNIALDYATLAVRAVGDATYAGSIRGPGNFVKAGLGSLTLVGSNNTYVGSTKVSQGVLVVNGVLDNTDVTVVGGTLSGSGVIGGPVTIGEGGTLALGSVSSVLTLTNDLFLDNASTTRVEIDPVRGWSSQVHELARVSYGGLLVVGNVAAARPIANGQYFHLFASRNSQGNFSRISPDPGPGMAWLFDSTTGILTAVAEPSLHVSLAREKFATISWSGQRFHLQVQTNAAGINMKERWFDYPGGTASPIVLPIDPAQHNVFFRLVTP